MSAHTPLSPRSTRAQSSQLADTIFVPSRRYDRAIRAIRYSAQSLTLNAVTHSPIRLHTRTVSCRYDIRATGLRTKLPSNVCTHSPVATLHTRTVLSQLADTIFVPSGLNCAEFTPLAVPLQCLHTLPCRHAPHAHSLVPTRRYDIRAIRAKLRRTHPTAVPLQCLHTLPCRHAPHAHSLVPTRRYDIRAIRAKLRRIHLTAVPLQCLHTLPCRHAPHAHSLVPRTRRYDIRAIRAKLRRIHPHCCAPPMSAHTPLSPRSTRAQSGPHSPIRYSCHPG